MADPGPDRGSLRELALRLEYMVDQVTPEEFSWQDANYDADSGLGRELLFLIAENEWVRATSEMITIPRLDAVETTIKIDVDLNRITHEAFRDRRDPFWLPVLVLPPLRKQFPEPDPFCTLTVTDVTGTPLPRLPNADVRHCLAAALTEIIINFADARLPMVSGQPFDSTRDHRLLLSAAIYRLLRNEHVPSAVLAGELLPRQVAGGQLPRLDHVRNELGVLLQLYSRLLVDAGPAPGMDTFHTDGLLFARQLTERATMVLKAFAECAFVVVAADCKNPQTVLSVSVPNRALLESRSGLTSAAGPGGAALSWRDRLIFWRWFRPSNWILPGAHLRIDLLLLPSADAERQVQVNMPNGVSPDPSRPPDSRARLDIRTERPVPLSQLAELVGQLTSAGNDWPPTLRESLADLTTVKVNAAKELLRDYRVGIAGAERAVVADEPAGKTKELSERLDELNEALRGISAQDHSPGSTDKLKNAWFAGDTSEGGKWLKIPIRRRTFTDTVSPDVMVARARMIEDASRRATPDEARMHVHVAVVDTEYFATATFSGMMSVLLMTVVLAFFVLAQAVAISGQQASAEVLAFVLTLFSAIQVGRIERTDQSTLRGRLAPAGNPLIIASILPTVILAVALAFSRTAIWSISWAIGCIGLQLLLVGLLRWLRSRALARGRLAGGGGKARPHRGLLLCTETPQYSNTEVLHSSWWRRTTADTLMLNRQAYGYVIWQHGASQAVAMPEDLGSVLDGGRPATDPDPGTAAGGNGGLSNPRLRKAANVVALQRSGTGAQSLTFAVFRDKPKADWPCTPEDVKNVDLYPGLTTPLEDATGVLGVFLGLDRDRCLLPIPRHPIIAVLQTAARHRLIVRDIQLPVPAPVAEHAGLQWSCVQIGLQDSDVEQVAPFLNDLRQLAGPAGSRAEPPSGDGAAWSAVPVVGVQTAAEGIVRILDPRLTQEEADRPIRLVSASDLDVVSASAIDESEAAKNWRVMAVGAEWRGGVEIQVLSSLDSELCLAGLTYAILHGKAVFLVLGHRAGEAAAHDGARPTTPGTRHTRMAVYIDSWQSREELGMTEDYPLLRVHVRTADRPGTTLAILESLREALRESAPGLRECDWNVWYARVVAAGNVVRIQLIVRLAINATTPAQQAELLERWRNAEFSRIEQRARTLAINKMAALRDADGSADRGLNTLENTVISVELIRVPALDPLTAR